MKINGTLFAKNEVLKMVMKKAHEIMKRWKAYGVKGKMAIAMGMAWEDVKAEIKYTIKKLNTKVVSYFDYKNKYSNYRTVPNSYNARKKEITILLNSVKRAVCGSCGHNDIIDGYCVDCSSKAY